MSGSDSDSPREQKRRHVQRYWFQKLPEEKQDEIVRPHFEEAHPTSEDVKQAVRDYEQR